MKKILLISLLTILSVFISKAQDANGWTKSDKENFYSDCKSYISKYVTLTDDQRESLSLCYANAMLKNYKKSDYQTKLDIEIKRIKETEISECAKNLSLELSEQKSEVKKDTVKVKKDDNTGELKPTKENLIGHWKDDESDIWLFETGDYKIKYFDGKEAKGTWVIENDLLSLKKEKLLGSNEKFYDTYFYKRQICLSIGKKQRNTDCYKSKIVTYLHFSGVQKPLLKTMKLIIEHK